MIQTDNILIRGASGTGKTYCARAIAYYMCMNGDSVQDAFSQNIEADIEKIEEFISNSDQCEFIQIHPAMDYDDIVYGLKINPSDGLQIEYAEKRVMKLCYLANGKDKKYCIIFDDIDRADAGRLLGNVLYAMEYRNQPVDLSDGKVLIIPDNVILIFTENSTSLNGGLDLAVRRRMTYLNELQSNRFELIKHYQGKINNNALKLILDVYDRVSTFINGYVNVSDNVDKKCYMPGHGMFMVNTEGNTHFVLDNFRQKIKFQVVPYLRELYSRGVFDSNPDSFIENLLSGVNVGIEGICPIKSISKKLVKKDKDVSTFSLPDSRTYYANTIARGGCKDYRGMMECVIDALILNRVFPYDVLLGSLLCNTGIAYIEGLRDTTKKAAYLVEKHEANNFMYETIRGGKISGTHAYYTLDVAATGRWQLENDTEEYIVSYYDGRLDREYIALSGFRNHGFNPDDPKLSVIHNTVNIMTAVHIVLAKYLEYYKLNIGLLMGEDDDYHLLYEYLTLEEEYLKEVKAFLKGRDPSKPTGDDERLEFYGNKILNLHTVWYGVGDCIEVNAKQFKDLVDGNIKLSMDSFEALFDISKAQDTVKIEIKGVLKMVDLNDYQKIMDNIGIRQMIFQGPPGTSKTFESKRFILKQLNSGANSFKANMPSQEEISNDLENYKLTDEDYSDPMNSAKLQTGGWDLVQFHPSYGYEDFIRGIEVKIPDGQSTPSYSSVNRILGRIAEFSKAAADYAAQQGTAAPKFYLVVDEINRANLATVFGELIYGLEYRNSKVSTPYEVKNAVSGEISKDIVIGKNLYIIGTMNTADKSIDAIDYAIRRRFMFVDSPANRDIVLECYKKQSGNNDSNSIELLLFDAVQNLFDSERFFNDEYQKADVKIGHTFFLRDRKRGYEDSIIEHFIFQVVPILREYVKDGILDTSENLIPIEHSVHEIATAVTTDDRIEKLSENIMLYVKEFGNLNKSNEIIDNVYIAKFIDELRKDMGF